MGYYRRETVLACPRASRKGVVYLGQREYRLREVVVGKYHPPASQR